MGDEPYTTQRATFQQKSAPLTNHQLAYATKGAENLFGSYRRGDANDPDRYVASIAAVLTLYDADLVREVTDPRTGIQTTEKHMTFMPNAGELKFYCDKIAAHREKVRGARPVRPAPRLYHSPQVGDLATVFVPEGHSRYASLVSWAETAESRMWRYGLSSDGRSGIWVCYEIWDGGTVKLRKTEAPPQRLELSPFALRAMAERDAVRDEA